MKKAVKKKWLLQTLVLSVSLNIVFFSIFFYFLVRDNPQYFTFQPAPKIESEPFVFNPALQSFSFEQLVELLKDERGVEESYRVCDLALGVLVAYHDLDLIRALKRPSFAQKRVIFREVPLTIFPALTPQDYQNINQFIQEEAWPLTSKGLFLAIEKEGIEGVDPELLTFFCHSPEFMALETLFVRTHLPVQKGSVLTMVLEGGWDRLASYFKGQEEEGDFSDRRRQTVLLNYIEGRSQTAANLLLLTDASFATQKIDDEQVSQILDLLNVEAAETVTFVNAITNSQRGDRVREQASEIVGRFTPRPGIGELRPTFRDQPPASPPPRLHVVQPGESLWLIARKYDVSIETLMEFNHLQSTVIQSKKTLKIPPS